MSRACVTSLPEVVVMVSVGYLWTYHEPIKYCWSSIPQAWDPTTRCHNSPGVDHCHLGRVMSSRFPPVTKTANCGVNMSYHGPTQRSSMARKTTNSPLVFNFVIPWVILVHPFRVFCARWPHFWQCWFEQFTAISQVDHQIWILYDCFYFKVLYYNKDDNDVHLKHEYVKKACIIKKS